MSDKILSQSEIEALLSSMSAEPEPEVAPGAVATEVLPPSRPTQPYDFRRPNKFSKDHLRALRILHGTFARLLASQLTSYLRNSVQIRLTMVEQVTYDEYIRSLPTPTVIYVTALNPLPGQGVVEVNLPVVLAIVDRLLGGTGQANAKPRDLTEIEMALVKKLGEYIGRSVEDAWQGVVPLKPVVQEPALTPEFVQVTLPTEITVMLMFEIAVLSTTGTISMCVPHAVLQPVLDSLTSQMWGVTGSQRDDDDEAQGHVQEQMHQVPLPVVVELGSARVTLRDLLDLPNGHILKLDTPATGSLRVRVGESAKFAARPGVKGRNLAVQITSVLTKETSMSTEFNGAGSVNGLFDDDPRAGAAPAPFSPLGGGEPVGEGSGIDLLMDVNLQVSVELGRTRMTIGELLALRAGSVIELDKLAGEPADILVNGTKIARGEVVVVDEKFGVRVMDIVTKAKRIASMG